MAILILYLMASLRWLLVAHRELRRLCLLMIDVCKHRLAKRIHLLLWNIWHTTLLLQKEYM